MPQQTGTNRFLTQRLSRGWTLRELAKRCAEKGAPVAFSQLSKIERGIYAPRPNLRAVLAELLDLDVVKDFERKEAS